MSPYFPYRARGEDGGTPMRMLFATDGSNGASVALEFLASLPLSQADTVTVLSVAARGERPHAQEVAETAVRALGARGIRTSLRVERGPVADAILAVALETVADLVVVGSRGLGTVSGALLGSTARALAHEAVVPVLAVRDRHEAPRHVLAAVDGSPEAERALAFLVRLPLPRGAGTTYLQLAPCERRAADEILSQAARASTDLIVLGTADQTTRRGLIETSLADQVLSGAHCPVLVASGGFAAWPVAHRREAVAGPV